MTEIDIKSAQVGLIGVGNMGEALAPLCVGGTGIVLVVLLFLAGKEKRAAKKISAAR